MDLSINKLDFYEVWKLVADQLAINCKGPVNCFQNILKPPPLSYPRAAAGLLYPISSNFMASNYGMKWWKFDDFTGRNVKVSGGRDMSIFRSSINKPGSRGQASNGIQKHYADRSVSQVSEWEVRESVSRPRLDVCISFNLIWS